MLNATDVKGFETNPYSHAQAVSSAGAWISIVGVMLPLFLIGSLKFTQYEVEALKPVIRNTPWLAWLYPMFGEAGTSYLLGVVELITVALLIASHWSLRAGILGGALGVLTFAVTTSTMLALPIWHTPIGGFPWLNELGSFLVKDVALLGICLVVLGENLKKLSVRS